MREEWRERGGVAEEKNESVALREERGECVVVRMKEAAEGLFRPIVGRQERRAQRLGREAAGLLWKPGRREGPALGALEA